MNLVTFRCLGALFQINFRYIRQTEIYSFCIQVPSHRFTMMMHKLSITIVTVLTLFSAGGLAIPAVPTPDYGGGGGLGGLGVQCA
jgi:hypothetical protein